MWGNGEPWCVFSSLARLFSLLTLLINFCTAVNRCCKTKAMKSVSLKVLWLTRENAINQVAHSQKDTGMRTFTHSSEMREQVFSGLPGLRRLLLTGFREPREMALKMIWICERALKVIEMESPEIWFVCWICNLCLWCNGWLWKSGEVNTNLNLSLKLVSWIINIKHSNDWQSCALIGN